MYREKEFAIQKRLDKLSDIKDQAKKTITITTITLMITIMVTYFLQKQEVGIFPLDQVEIYFPQDQK